MCAEHVGKLRYQVVAEMGFHESLGAFPTYGIHLQGVAEGHLHDVSVNRSVAATLAALFTRLQLSPIHLRDAVEDLLP